MPQLLKHVGSMLMTLGFSGVQLPILALLAGSTLRYRHHARHWFSMSSINGVEGWYIPGCD